MSERVITPELRDQIVSNLAYLRPQPFDISKPKDVSRLLHETIGYMRVSLKHGTDLEGRRFALQGLEAYLAAWIDGTAPVASGALPTEPHTETQAPVASEQSKPDSPQPDMRVAG